MEFFFPKIKENVADNFNNLFGSNVTHIANAYKTPENFLHVFYHSEELPSPGLNPVATEMITISYMHYHKKERSNASDYCTIKLPNGVTLCSNFKLRANQSFIIAKNGEIKLQKYGARNLFEDEKGNNHFRRYRS